MAWSSPRTWTTGEVVTAAHMNQEVRDNLDAQFPDENTGVAWSPTLEATSTDAVTTVQGRQYRVGAEQKVWARFVIGATGGGGSYFVTLPVAASGLSSSASSGQGTAVGSWQARDDSNIGVNEGGTVVLRSSTTVHFQRPVGGVLTNNNPWTWTNPDVLSFHAVYPVA